MKIATTVIGAFKKDLEREFVTLTGAVQGGMRSAADGLKKDLRDQVTGAGMGSKLANTWRSAVYENRGYDPVGFVYTRAPQIIQAFDQGVLIKPQGGHVWLAIPTDTAPKKGTDGKRITPLNFPEDKLGKLEFTPQYISIWEAPIRSRIPS